MFETSLTSQIEQIVSYEKGTDDDIEELIEAVMSGNISKPELDRIAGAIASMFLVSCRTLDSFRLRQA